MAVGLQLEREVGSRVEAVADSPELEAISLEVVVEWVLFRQTMAFLVSMDLFLLPLAFLVMVLLSPCPST